MDSKKAYNAAIRMLGRREHSQGELASKLRQKFSGLPPSELDQLLDELKQHGLQSDTRFAESLVRSRIGRGYGPYYIRRELAFKGVAGDLIDEQLEQADADWADIARDLVERKHPTALDHEQAWGKAVRFLQRRGFSGDLASKAVGPRPFSS